MESHDTAACLVKVGDVARMLSITERTVWRLTKEGQFPAPVHIGGSTRWRTEDLLEYVRNLAVEIKELTRPLE